MMKTTRMILGMALAALPAGLSAQQPQALSEAARKKVECGLALFPRGSSSNDYSLPHYVEPKRGVLFLGYRRPAAWGFYALTTESAYSLIPSAPPEHHQAYRAYYDLKIEIPGKEAFLMHVNVAYKTKLSARPKDEQPSRFTTGQGYQQSKQAALMKREAAAEADIAPALDGFILAAVKDGHYFTADEQGLQRASEYLQALGVCSQVTDESVRQAASAARARLKDDVRKSLELTDGTRKALKALEESIQKLDK